MNCQLHDQTKIYDEVESKNGVLLSVAKKHCYTTRNITLKHN